MPGNTLTTASCILSHVVLPSYKVGTGVYLYFIDEDTGVHLEV